MRDHFAAMIDTTAGAASQRGDESKSMSANSANTPSSRPSAGTPSTRRAKVLRDTRTTYHLLATPDGWRFSRTRITFRVCGGSGHGPHDLEVELLGNECADKKLGPPGDLPAHGL